jgi:amidophosphoribosyltransferase
VAAKGYAIESGIPLNDGFVKNRYVARTFIKPEQGSREQAVQLKLNPMRAVVNGKRVIIIDDSIVRGTTSKQIVKLMREAGATEVHMLSSAPEFIAPCYFGTDIPSKDQLMACKYTVEEMCEIIGADSLGFLQTEDMLKIAPNCKQGLCTGCFTEHYPTDNKPL